MKMTYRLACLLVLLILLASTTFEPLYAEESSPVSLDEALQGYQLNAGFTDLYVAQDSANIRVLLPAADSDGINLRFIHALRLSAGLGSNPLGLDRGWGNNGQLVQFRQIGKQVIAEVENQRYRANTTNNLEKTAVKASFARSFIWSTEVIAKGSDGRVLIDITDLLTQDMLGLAEAMQETGANFKLASDRSLPATDSILNFPDNTEIDTYMTFTSKSAGGQVQATAANPGAVTLIQHHSLVRLPDDNYQPRKADRRTGTFALGFYDYAVPLDAQVVNAYAMRHRLEHQIKGDNSSPVVKPIVFYIDAGAPANIQQALQEGASWWSDAFAAAGFVDGFRVEILPADAHPLDIRYNVVQWVHRQTRGWSYGGGIIDPRTGEFIKGHVILGSQRVRQDRMIFEGLAGTDKTGTGAADDPVELALARIRQLAAHEVGHSLGFGHNFAASVNSRASVMDYPAPWVLAQQGELDFSKTYDTGIGAWDIHTTKWLYSEFDDATDETQALTGLIDDARSNGLLYVGDSDARSVDTAQAQGAVWDNGDDPVAELENVLTVREIALGNFDLQSIQTGQSRADLRGVLTPIYLYHRYQVAAAAKSLGGVVFDYGLRDNALPVKPVVSQQQQKALTLLLQTLQASFLAVPESLLEQLPPGHDSYWFSIPNENLSNRTGATFDWLLAAETATDISLNALLSARRLERLYQQHAVDDSLPGVLDVLQGINETLLHDDVKGDYLQRVQFAALSRYVSQLISLTKQTSMSGAVLAQLRATLVGLQSEITSEAKRFRRANAQQYNSLTWLTHRIEQHLKREAPESPVIQNAPNIPPGSPIGGASTLFQSEACWHCDD